VPYDGQPAGATVSIPAYSVLIYAYGAAGGLRSPLQRLIARLFGRLGRSLRRVPLGARAPD
jgi:hypothetical protein